MKKSDRIYGTSFSGTYSEAVDYCQYKFFYCYGVKPSKSSIKIVSCFDRLDGEDWYPQFDFYIYPGDGRAIRYITTMYGVEKYPYPDRV